MARHNEYELLDSGAGRKLERFGGVIVSRPCAQAVWEPQMPDLWRRAHASFTREDGWQPLGETELPRMWDVTINGIRLRLAPTPAGHLGVFPETRAVWDWITDTLTPLADNKSVLNLFAYSGGATLAAAIAGSPVCHVDSSKSMVTRARQNADLNQVGDAPIRWIVDDAGKFLGREIRRGRKYDAIMLDPPSYGHGVRGEQYRFDRDLVTTLRQCRELLSDAPVFVLLTSHTEGVTAANLGRALTDVFDGGRLTSGEMSLTGAEGVRPVPSGVWTRWTP